MALAAEIYSLSEAITLFDRYPLRFIDNLIHLTIYRRQDPEELQAQRLKEQLKERLIENPEEETAFFDGFGKQKNINLSELFLDF